MHRPHSLPLLVCLCLLAGPASPARARAVQAAGAVANVRGAEVPAAAGWARSQAPDPIAQASQGPVFRAEVDLVLQAVAVLDHTGAPVTDLKREEFRVYEDGRPQEIRLFLAPEEAGLDVAVVLDTSGSLAPWSHPVRRAVKTLLASLDPADCVFLLPFNARVGPGLWGRAQDPLMARRVDAILFDGGTALYDAVWQGIETIEAMSTAPTEARAAGEADSPVQDAGAGERNGARGVAEAIGQQAGSASDPEAGEAAGRVARPLTRARLRAGVERLATQTARELSVADRSRAGCGEEPAADADESGPRRRRAVVVFSDGDDEDSGVRLDQLVDRAGAAAIPLFPVLVGQAHESVALRTVLERLASVSGGALIEAASPQQLRAAFEDVVALLRASYLLGYRPPPDSEGRWHEVSVRSRRPSYRLVYRDRYYR